MCWKYVGFINEDSKKVPRTVFRRIWLSTKEFKKIDKRNKVDWQTTALAERASNIQEHS